MESGTEKLKRAHNNLLRAQAETKNILTPILLRMSKSKKIKSADIALQSISVLLSFPHNMRIALNLGNYEEVLVISKKIQLLSPGNVLSSAKILIQVQLTATLIVEELKEKCLAVLLGLKRGGVEVEKDSFDDDSDNEENDENENGNNNNNNNSNGNYENFNNSIKLIPEIPKLTRYSILLQDMVGEEKQKSYLKSCFYKQLTLFGEEINKYRKKYFENLLDAVAEGKKNFQSELDEKKNPKNKNKNDNNDKNENGDDDSWFKGMYNGQGFADSNRQSKANSILIINPNKKNSINEGEKEKNNNFSITDFEGQKPADGLGSNWIPNGISKNERLILKNCINGKDGRKEWRGRREMGRKVEKRGSGMLDGEEDKIFLEFGLSDDEYDNNIINDDDNDINNENNNENKDEENIENNEETQASGAVKKRRGGIFLVKETKEHFYCELFCSRVRLLYVLRIVRAMEAWTPVLAQ